MPINDEFLQTLKDRNPIENIIERYVPLKRAGSNLKGLCPFHNEKSPSLTVYPSSDSFFCFGCHTGGDAITFVKNIENLDYIETVRLLAEQSGLIMPEENVDNSYQLLKSRMYEINRAAARFYFNKLFEEKNTVALKYLLDRKIIEQTIKHFGLGFSGENWDDLYKHLHSLNYDNEELIQANLVGKNKNGGFYDRFRNRIMFPIIDLRGNVIAFGGRILPSNDTGAKYINSSDTPVFKKSANLFSMQFAKNSKAPIILVEGYLDVITLHQAGFVSAVAALGTAFTNEQAKLIKKYSREVFLLLDSDSAGQAATNRAIDILQANDIKTKVVILSDCKDPDEFIRKYGSERFSSLLNKAENDIEYKISQIEKKHDLSTNDGKINFLNESCLMLSNLNDEIIQDLFASKLSEQQNIAKSALVSKIKQYTNERNKKQKSKHLREITTPVKPILIDSGKTVHTNLQKAEENIIFLLINFSEYRKEIADSLDKEHFVTDFYKKLFIFISQKITECENIEVIHFSGNFTDEELSIIVQIFNRQVSKSDLDKICKDSIRFLHWHFEQQQFNKKIVTDDFENIMSKIIEEKNGGKS